MLLLLWLTLATLRFDVLRTALLTQEVLDPEERLQCVLPERRADAEQHHHDRPTEKRHYVRLAALPPLASVLPDPRG